MTLLLNFITAMAWLWGVPTGLFFVLVILGIAMNVDDKAKLVELGSWVFQIGFIPWAWLIARYCL